MQYLLIAILGLASIMLVGMGVAQRFRRRQLARTAGELGLNFSADDLFDLPRRYAGFKLMQTGHSPCADNVMFGRLHGWQIRYFDLHVEAGHGPQRVIRRYSVVSAEGGKNLAEAALLPWPESGSDLTAAVAGCSIEAGDETVMFSVPKRLRAAELKEWLWMVNRSLERLGSPA